MTFEYRLKMDSKYYHINADNVMEAVELIKRTHKFDGLDFPYNIEKLYPIHKISVEITMTEARAILHSIDIKSEVGLSVYHKMEDAIKFMKG